MKTPLPCTPTPRPALLLVGRRLGWRGACAVLALLLPCLPPCGAFAQTVPAPTPSPATRKRITNEADLPRFRYPLTTPPSEFLHADAATFDTFARRVETDLRGTLEDCEIADQATRRGLLEPLFYLALLAAQDDTARALLPPLQASESKEARRLTTWRVEIAYLQAAQTVGSKTGPEFARAFEAADRALTDALPWETVQEVLRQEQGERQALLANGANLLTGLVKERIDPAYAKTAAIDLPGARLLIRARAALTLELPLWAQDAPVLRAYMDAHTTRRPDLWPARDVTLTAEQTLAPVAVAVWDDGVDPQAFPGQMFESINGTPQTLHGLAFDNEGHPSASWLYPLTPAQQAEYPQLLELLRGTSDRESNVQSPAAAHVEEILAKSSPQQSADLFHSMRYVLEHYLHGTHVAGIAVRGNPAARVAVFRFNGALRDLPFRPSLEYVETMREDFAAIGRYAAANHVRVVNMSWGDNVAEFEEWLARTDANADPAVRKQTAQALFEQWRRGIKEAVRGAPDTLFCAAAGNSNQDAGFQGYVPTALEEPNLLTVGAVDQAGNAANFTSYGKTVVIYANGWNVPSRVPGGGTLSMSGTSMAAPQVANLAAKLFALEPTLTAVEVRRLILDGATPSEDGKRPLLNPRRSVELLGQRAAKR